MKYKLDNLILKQDAVGNIKIYQNRLKQAVLLIVLAGISFIIFVLGIISIITINFIAPVRCFGFFGVIFLLYLTYIYITEFRQDFTSMPSIQISILPPQVQIGSSEYYTQTELKHINLRREIIKNPKAHVFISGNPYVNENTKASLQSAFWESDTYFYVTLHLQNKKEIPLFQTKGMEQGDLATRLAEWIADTLKIPFKQVN